uniref:RRM domain-containing protein n=1 Tax=Dendroctonus ponderosae TaxID=77166 RepID=A0AAR5PM57_DENPD
MSEQLNEDLLNDATDDYLEIGEAEERALLKDDDDGDVLSIAPEDLPLESDHRNEAEKEGPRQEKFVTERPKITAPDTSGNKTAKFRIGKQNNPGRGRGGHFYQNRGRGNQFLQGRQNIRAGPQGRNKTVLINPRFQGVVHVNNTARLAWDAQQQIPSNPWANRAPAAHLGPAASVQQMQLMHPQSQMQHIHAPNQLQFQPPIQQFPYQPQVPNFQQPPQIQQMQQPPFQNIYPPGHQIQYPPSNQQFMPQPLPPVNMPHGPNEPMFAPYPQNSFESQNYNMSANANIQFIPPFDNVGQQPLHQQSFPPNENLMNSNRRVMLNGSNNNRFRKNVTSNTMMTTKRKISPGLQPQIRKRSLQHRLGNRVPQPQVQVEKFTVSTEDRPSVVKEVTVTNVTTVKIEDDEETRDLRLKIEEQKRKREEILKWKELRRLANLQSVKSLFEPQPPKQHMIKSVQQRQGQVKNRGNTHQQNQQLSAGMRAPVLQSLQQVDERGQTVAKGAQFATSAQVSLEEPDIQLDARHISTFLADRKVLLKDEALMTTRKVLIKNIATSTGDKKIYQICKNIGEVQKLHRDKNDRHATITFKSVASAHAFFKKYQRHMLDLSMIEVVLTPESDEQ